MNKYQLKKNLLEQLPAIMVKIFINFFSEMLQEFIHLFTFMLHDFISDVGSFVICFIKLMILQAAESDFSPTI